MLTGFGGSRKDAKPMLPKAVEQLKEDFKGENADAREEDLWRADYEKRIAAAKEKYLASRKSAEHTLQLAEAYAVLDPEDKSRECIELCEEIKSSVKTLDTQRAGDFWYLYGRTLFFHNHIEESLLAMLKSKEKYKEKGTKLLRKRTNTGLLRIYAALGKSKLAAERLEVALTLCEKDKPDEVCLLYQHAKNALEHTGEARDAEVLDDIWYVAVDTDAELKKKHEEFQHMVKGVFNQSMGGKPDDDDDIDLTWKELERRLKIIGRDLYKEPMMRAAFIGLVLAVAASFVWLIYEGLRN